jgi:hypothetical protein
MSGESSVGIEIVFEIKFPAGNSITSWPDTGSIYFPPTLRTPGVGGGGACPVAKRKALDSYHLLPPSVRLRIYAHFFPRFFSIKNKENTFPSLF